jgi:CRP-like cAMP-binding protein
MGERTGSLGDAERAALQKIGVKRGYAAGEALCAEGEEGDTLFIIETGAARVVRYAANGRDAILAFLGPGDVIGEIACLGGVPRAAAVEAQTAVQAWVVRRGDVLALLRRDADLAASFIRLLATRLSEADALLMSMSALKMRGRLASGLLQLFARHGKEAAKGARLKLEITQRELGAFVGLSRENVSRVLAEWRLANIIAIEPGGEIVLRDRDRLEDLALDDE